ncbi:hypothetical protein Phum_PHUM263690 [Pediculus humanus corporis]|uniref:Uncharacterized protein n=1 Tax=Pediculus humanus subsp. corporis TaxID=121224 RepID=E0VKH9_PEDHC|nr:uncharacterized protein Phum_PHUM263690 [Pediculus humanus corporis]EEB13885.1 hypothetical protein Phum_PHUM263690 [Pediculus humanus corporis]
MSISRSSSYQSNMSLPVMFWTSVFLLLFARGVYCNEEQNKFDRYTKIELDPNPQGYTGSDVRETYNAMNILRELIQRHQQQDDWRKVPIPLLYQIKAIINDGRKEKDKRGSCENMFILM